MTTDWERRMADAALAVAATQEHWRRQLTGARELIRAEGSTNPVLQLLDRAGFVDYLGVRPDGVVSRIAMRVQFEPCRFASHTIREELLSLAATEWQKLSTAARTDPSALPSQHVQLYMSADGHRFIGGGSVDSAAFVAWLAEHWDELEIRYSPEKFRIAWWRRMRGDGVEVRTLGEDKLRDSLRSGDSVFRYFHKKIAYGPCPQCGMATPVGFKGERSYPPPTRCAACRIANIQAALDAPVAGCPWLLREQGPCARCGEACRRYDMKGSPFCESCTSSVSAYQGRDLVNAVVPARRQLRHPPQSHHGRQ